jgi:DNA-binding HxlR family transcriptional regulator
MTGYGQYCPVSRALDVLGQRWALLVVRELVGGDLRFRDIQRGVPTCPPATLTKRLRELVAAGVVEQRGQDGATVYGLSPAGAEVYPVLDALGRWGQRWVRSTYEPEEVDAAGLLWDQRGFFDPGGLGVERAVVELQIAQAPASGARRFWVVVAPEGVDVCLVDPGRPVDALIEADVRTLARIWMGDVAFEEAARAGEVRVSGAAPVVRRIPGWYPRHPALASVGRAEA